MKTFLRRIKLLCSITLPLLNSGCSARAPLNAQAQAGRPIAAVVEEVSYPYDPSKPRFAIIVEPMQPPLGYSNITLVNGGIFPVWDQLSAQLTTTLRASEILPSMIHDELTSPPISAGYGDHTLFALP